jgi:transcription-repair coupling factor (superfamily II helicase)
MRKIVAKKNIEAIEPFNNLLTQINQAEIKVNVGGLVGAARSFLTALLAKSLERTMLVVCPEEKEAIAFAADLSLFLGNTSILYYPPLDFLSIDMLALQKEEALTRLKVFSRLQKKERMIIVASAGALMQKVMPLTEFHQNLQTISLGDTLDIESFCNHLIAGGYKRVSLVEERGEFSIRGNIIDIFSPSGEMPQRLELSGEEIESIREFDCASQRSVGSVAAFIVPPASEILINQQTRALAMRNIRRRVDELSLPREMRNDLIDNLKSGIHGAINPIFLPLFYEEYDDKGVLSQNRLSDFFNYLPQDTLIILDDLLAINQVVQNAENAIDKILYKSKNSGKFYLEKQNIYLNPSETLEAINRFSQVCLEGLTLGEDQSIKRLVFQTQRELLSSKSFAGEIKEDVLLRQTIQNIKSWLAEDMLIFFICPTAEDLQRMRNLFLSYDLPVQILPHHNSIVEILKQGEAHPHLLLWEGKVSTNFIFPAINLVVLSEEEIFGKKAPRRRVRPAREAYFLKSFGDLKEGDFVVHTDFGIGIYRGLKKISVGKTENDFLVIEYLEGDKLYIPVNSLQKIQKYIGPDSYVPKIDRMGGTSWDALKERVKKSVREVAEELVSIYAAREVMERKSFSPPDQIYEEFCATFEFEETPDQTKAIEDVHMDMDEVKPMDRLICGDAGFGKTEVAVRSAFRAVMDGKQVAVLVPTTILAEQHYQTFLTRLKDFPVRVEVLNRFKSAAEQKKIIQDLKSQKVDIIVGTHRLLQKDVEFKELGLVIIDEEQRFGVTHKEKLKKMRTLVDVLTLSATPIPRTLHLSLVGIRDLSVINTPPEERVPIKTYVLEFDKEVIKAAVEKELARQGQVFFVHDRVRSIYSITDILQRLVPQAKIGIIHGQMKPAEIEKSMAEFVRHKTNVLVSTTIVGSGLDIPTANTIVINRADRLGLAQLYQLRGRVGRASREAFAYLLLPRGAMLSREAMKRLQVIKEFSEPGSGFLIAHDDLEIRGGGNLLGISQSGHFRSVGYELYAELMEKTIREIKGEKNIEEELLPEIQLGVSAFIPEEYVHDVYRRLVLYKRISLAVNQEDVDEIKSELEDCYGTLPLQVDNLLHVISIRNSLKLLQGEKMGYDGKYLYIFFRNNSSVDPAKIVSLYRKKIRELRFTPDYKLFIPAPSLPPKEILAQANLLLKMLAQ